MLLRNVFFVAFSILGPISAIADDFRYWDIVIPTLQGAENASYKKDEERGTHTLTYEISLHDHKTPLNFYNKFFTELGWAHHMADTYSKYPSQFDTPPMEKWSSISTREKDGHYGVSYGSLWQNEHIGSNASVEMHAIESDGELLNAKIKVSISPNVDMSGLLKLVTLVRDNPKSFLKLVSVAGGDPFEIYNVDMEKVRQFQPRDDLFQSYIDAVDSIIFQMSEFSKAQM